jgi:hypothetical protein
MTRYASKDFKNLKVGIASFSDGKTTLEVTGRLGVNTSTAQQELHVEGSAYISNSIGIGTTVPGDVVDVANRKKISVGIVTANEYYGSGLGLTGITSAGSASNIFGGAAGRLLYQEQAGVTTFFENGSTGQGLYSRGPGQPPQWLPVAPVGAIEGITLFDEGSVVGMAGSFSALDIRGNNINVIGVVTSGEIGIGTITVSDNIIVDTLVINGVSTASTITGADYFGTGDNITGIVTSISIGAGLTFTSTEVLGGFAKGAVTLTSIAATNNILADTLTVSGVSTLNNVTLLDTGFVDNGTFRNTNLIGVTSVANLDANTIDVTNLVALAATITGNLTVGGTLSYSDVSNIDAVGLITAREGIHIGDPGSSAGIAATLTKQGGAIFTGVVTALNYFGNGSDISGIVTSLVAGENISVSSATGRVTITGLAKTDIITADQLTVIGVSTLGGGVNIGGTTPNVAIGVTLENTGDAQFAGIITSKNLVATESVGIGTDTLNPNFALEVTGDTNVEGNLTINENTVPTLAMVIALGGL